ncbi:hypothetical protein RF11_12928 [Thelohanellus kitauei]|uniref:Uncharacterized protein n=1 Tax=Thelohanellus kitauei TaxID=669202 RepID=A0A0C2MYZ6_THEKT|nr:hypothetical protein RF11_12928 [Thelohanellus kitauei]
MNFSSIETTGFSAIRFIQAWKDVVVKRITSADDKIDQVHLIEILVQYSMLFLRKYRTEKALSGIVTVDNYFMKTPTERTHGFFVEAKQVFFVGQTGVVRVSGIFYPKD